MLAVSVSYEFIEWGAAMALGAAADDFLGTQGDPWDTQWDMFMALIGASIALLLLSRWHDRQIAGIVTPCRQRCALTAPAAELCCVAPAFDADQGFGHDKPA